MLPLSQHGFVAVNGKIATLRVHAFPLWEKLCQIIPTGGKPRTRLDLRSFFCSLFCMAVGSSCSATLSQTWLPALGQAASLPFGGKSDLCCIFRTAVVF